MYVESVKSGGASEKAGLVAGDMILKVSLLTMNISLNGLIIFCVLGKWQ